MKHSISSEIIIHASSAVIWEKLTKIKDYPSWNPFITILVGELRKGNRIKAEIGGMKFKPEVLSVIPNKELKWLGSLIIRGLFDGEHRFQIIENDDGSCLFIQSEKFSGILVGLFLKKLDTETLDGFRAMNVALKERCEVSKLI